MTKGLGSGSGTDYSYKKEFEYHYDGSVKSESATVDESVNITDAHRSIYKQDPTGRRHELDPADGDPITFEYPSPFMTKMTDSAGVVTIEDYQPFAGFGSELLISRRHPSGNTSPSPELELKITYRKNGQLDTVTSGNSTQYFNYYDSGLLESYSTKETGLVQYQYDDNGNLTWEKHNEDTPIRYQYDNLNRLIKKEFTDESLNVDYSYNDFTRVQTVEKNSFGWKYTLNKDEQILEAHLVHKSELDVTEVVNNYPVYTLATGQRRVNNGGPGRSGSTTFEYYDYHKEGQVSHPSGNFSSRGYLDWKFQYQYDSMSYLALIKYPDGEEVGYLRDSLGRPSQAGSYVSNVTYWPNGAVRSIQFANGMRSDFKQDAVLGKLKEIQHGNYWHKQYDYQSSSYISSIVDVLDQSKSLYLDYDQLYQLKNVHSGSANGAVIEAFKYTSTGDLITKTRSGVTTHYNYSDTSNRLASVQRNGQTSLVGYTPDGRINIYGQHDYGYTDDKLLASYNLPNGDQFQYLYDGTGRKIKTLRNGNLESYTIYDHRGKLIYEETPGDVTNNLIYLDDRLVAKREGLYDVRYAECDYIENKQQFQTLLMHRPVYLHKHSGEPVAYGNCERYGEWVHDFKSNSGVWETVSNTKREYWVWVNQYALSDRNRSNNQGSLYRWRYKDMYAAKVRMERKYEASGTKRKYKCYVHYEIKKRVYNLKQGGYTTQTVYSKKYYTGRQKIWRMWEKKPKGFSCQNPGLDYSKINWPNMSGQ